jgi:hypothetical protein
VRMMLRVMVVGVVDVDGGGGEGGDVVGDDGGEVRGSLLPPLRGGVRQDGPQETRVRWGDVYDEDFFVLVVLWDRGGLFYGHPRRGGGELPLLDGGTVARS